jgi:hypothetical protein
MRVLIDSQAVTLTDRDQIGVGGEATVYRWRDRAVKIYHPLPTGADPQALAALQRKVDKIRAFPQGLPAEVVAPQSLVLDAKGTNCLGFVMPLVMGGEDIRRLAQRPWRDGVVSNEQVVRIFARLHRTLSDLHARGMVVGDLNDGNVLFTGETPWLIDADSMQVGTHGCPVAHESFLDPRLYGVDLTTAAVFTPETDWYAFAVLLFRSLLYVHPYGGVHPTLPTMLRRAEARHSVMQPDVQYPKVADTWRILPDALIDWFAGAFDRDERRVFPETLLTMVWTTCACGSVHARKVCPQCAVVRPIDRLATEVQGRCRATVIMRTTGRILTATVQGSLRYAYEEDGVIRRENGSVVTTGARLPGMRFAIAGTSTWIGLREQVIQIEHEMPVTRTTCGTFGGDAVFATNSRHAYRLAGDWLIDAVSGTRIGQAVDGQTWFRMGETFGCGFYRAGRMTVFFVVDPRHPGLKQVTLPHIEGRLLDAHATFDGDRVLLELSQERNGRRWHSLAVVQADGRVLANLEGSPEDKRALATIGGKTMLGSCILCPTDDGLLSLAVDPASGTMTEGNLFLDTEPFVTEGATLLPGPGGSVYVVTPQAITQLTLM